MKKKAGAVIFTLIMLYMFYGSLKYSSQISGKVYSSLLSCVEVIIPSLYCFMIISGIFVKSNLYLYIGRIISPFSEKVFGLSGDIFSVFIMSQIGGYPVGAKLLKELERNGRISPEDTGYMLCYCYASGPAFIIGVTNAVCCNCTDISKIVFISIIMSNVIIALLLRNRNKLAGRENSSLKNLKINFNIEVLTESVQSAAYSIFQISIMIIMFGAIIAVTSANGMMDSAGNFISYIFGIDSITAKLIVQSAIEVTRITDCRSAFSLPYAAALLSFGGICVIMQTAFISGKSFKPLRFIFIRLSGAIISFLLCDVLMQLLYRNISIYTSAAEWAKTENVSIIPSIFLFIMTILLLLKKGGQKN